MNEPHKHLPYRLGLDVGSNSLGWFIVWLDESGNAEKLGPGGVRIYPDGRNPQSKSSNAVTRRVARGARRRRDRYLARRKRLMDLLILHGLMPQNSEARKSLECLNPYVLRADALNGSLPIHHVGRAMFHLNQRRGFKSNRKTERGDNEAGAIKEAAARLENLIIEFGARTLGEYLNLRHADRQPVRARNRINTPGKVEYDFYPTRALLEAEFDAIWAAQAQQHPEMTEDARVAIRHEIFFQRELRRPQVGKCTFDPAHDTDDVDGFRCSWSHPLAQRFRIWQETRNLAVTETGSMSRPLTKEEGDKVALALMQNGKVSFNKLRSLLNLSSETRFNLESEKRDKLSGDETAAKLAHKNFFGKAWRGKSLDRQIAIIERLTNDENEDALVDWLIKTTAIDADAASRIASALLPDGHCRLGLRAIGKILPHMEAGMNYPDAARAAGYDHALLPTGELSLNGRLPYYGEWLKDDVIGSGDRRDSPEKRWGKFPNPTVHIGLGQIRRVVNALIAEYGAPDQIVVELARDFKLSPTKLSELEKEQAKNQKKNDDRAKQLAAHGQPINHRNLLKLRLWEELNPYDPIDRCCPYSGEKIGIARLLSAEIDIDHLIPFQTCWDDSAANKIVCLSGANRKKGKRTPFQAFGAGPNWSAIAERANSLPKGKRWRFAPDAHERFAADGGFLARQLNETGWLARLTRKYLAAVTDPNAIWVLPGRHTALIRAKWGLNELLPDHNFSNAKNRKDHRHHAIDAMVAALSDRSLLHRMANAYDEQRQKIEVPLPWETLRDDLKERLDSMIVSHKSDHAPQGRLHEDTAYGTVKQPVSEGGANLVYRKGFLDLKQTEIARIRDPRLADLVTSHIESEILAGNDLASALRTFAARTDIPGLPHGIRHVRLLKTEKPEYLVSIRDRDGKAYKSYSAGENAYVDILETPDGKWIGRGTSVFQANIPDFQPRWATEEPRPHFIMRLYKGDILRLELDDEIKIMRIVRLVPSNSLLYLVGHNEAGSFQTRHDDKEDPFRWMFPNFNKLKSFKATQVRVDFLGRVWRVEPRERYMRKEHD